MFADLIKSVLQDPTTTTSMVQLGAKGRTSPAHSNTWSKMELLVRELAEAQLPPAQLCRRMVTRAAEAVAGDSAEPPHGALVQQLRTINLLLAGLGDGVGESEVVGETGQELVWRVCLPYLALLFRDCTSARLDAVRAVAETMGSLLLSSHLPAEMAVGILRDGIIPLVTAGRKGAGGEGTEREVPMTTFLCCLFSHAPPEQLEMVAGCGEELSCLFPHLLGLLGQSEPGTCHRLATSLLSAFITASSPQHVAAVWRLVGDVFRQRTVVEGSALGLALALLCCFSDVLIARDPHSPFSAGFPSGVADLCPLLDVRVESEFWAVVGEGLVSGDPLDRKRGAYLLHRVLTSVRGGGEVVSEGGVFWWSVECDGALRAVWEDLLLILDTMEEKQARHDVL